jgi:hypothetical protein
MPRPIFFHIHANTWHCKRFIHALEHEGHWLVSEASKVEALFSFFDGIPGTVPQRLHSIDLGSLNPPHLPLSEMGGWFMEHEILQVIRELPPDKALGPDDFTTRFLQCAYDDIKPKIIVAFDAFWYMDACNF